MTEPPESRATASAMLPVPEAAPQAEPLDATQAQVAPLSDDGSVSVIVALVTLDGPLLVATIVYVTLVPGVSVPMPSVLVIDRSALGASVSVSVAELLVDVESVTPLGTATEAVFVNDPVAPAMMPAVSV